MHDTFGGSASSTCNTYSRPLWLFNAALRHAAALRRDIPLRIPSTAERMAARRRLDHDAGELFDGREAGEDLVHAVVPERAHAGAHRGRLQLVAGRLLRGQ